MLVRLAAAYRVLTGDGLLMDLRVAFVVLSVSEATQSPLALPILWRPAIHEDHRCTDNVPTACADLYEQRSSASSHGRVKEWLRNEWLDGIDNRRTTDDNGSPPNVSARGLGMKRTVEVTTGGGRTVLD